MYLPDIPPGSPDGEGSRWRHGHPDVARVWALHPGVGRVYWVLTLGCALFGVAMVASGHDRTTAAAFATVNATGGPFVWGGIWFGCAAALYAGRMLGVAAARLALYVAAAVSMLFGLGFGAAAAVPGSTASWLGGASWVVLAVVFVAKAASFDDPRDHPGGAR